MDFAFHIADIARVIQLAVAPVFLLTGIGAFLSVLSFRLGRIVDRARQLEEHVPAPERRESVNSELQALRLRAALINRAIILCTSCALMICLVIVVIFVGTFLGLEIARAIAALFVIAMLSLIASLLTFLREIRLATATLRISEH